MTKEFPVYVTVEGSESTGDFYVKLSANSYMEYSDFFIYGGQSYSRSELTSPYGDDDTSYSLQFVGYAANMTQAENIVNNN